MQTQFCSGMKQALLYRWEGRCVFRVIFRPTVTVSKPCLLKSLCDPPAQCVIADAFSQRSRVSPPPMRAVGNLAAPGGADLSTSQPCSFYCLSPRCQLSAFSPSLGDIRFSLQSSFHVVGMNKPIFPHVPLQKRSQRGGWWHLPMPPKG